MKTLVLAGLLSFTYAGSGGENESHGGAATPPPPSRLPPLPPPNGLGLTCPRRIIPSLEDPNPIAVPANAEIEILSGAGQMNTFRTRGGTTYAIAGQKGTESMLICLYTDGSLRASNSGGSYVPHTPYTQWPEGAPRASDSGSWHDIARTPYVQWHGTPASAVTFHLVGQSRTATAKVTVRIMAPSSPRILTNRGCTCYQHSIAEDGTANLGCSLGWCDVVPGCEGALFGRAGGNPYAGWGVCTSASLSVSMPVDPENSNAVRVKVRDPGNPCDPRTEPERCQAVHCADLLQFQEDGTNACRELSRRLTATAGANVRQICDTSMAVISELMPNSTADMYFDLSTMPIWFREHSFGQFCPHFCHECDCSQYENNGQCNAGIECALGTDIADCFCRYTNDGICDEGSLCPLNSDRDDCNCDFQADGICDEGQACSFGSDHQDCCPTTEDGVCDEGRLCPHLSDRVDCFCPTVQNGMCDEVDKVRSSTALGSCALFSDYADCAVLAEGGKYCPPTYTHNHACDAGQLCPIGTDSECDKDEHSLFPLATQLADCTGKDSDTTCDLDSEYCSQFSVYSYMKACRPCSVHLGDGKLHVCADFAAVPEEDVDVCDACETFNDLEQGCSLQKWTLRLYSPDGRGWNGQEYRLDACDSKTGKTCTAEGTYSSTIVRGSPVATHGDTGSAQRQSKGVSILFKRHICPNAFYRRPHQRSATGCYRFTSFTPFSGSFSASVPNSSQITWDLVDSSGSVITSGGYGTFLFAVNVTPAGKEIETSSSGTKGGDSRRLQSATASQGCDGVEVCAATEANVLVSIRPSGPLIRRARERWTLRSEAHPDIINYNFNLCDEFDHTRRIEGAQNCVQIPASGVIEYSLCVPRSATYRFAYFSSDEVSTSTSWNISVGGKLLGHNVSENPHLHTVIFNTGTNDVGPNTIHAGTKCDDRSEVVDCNGRCSDKSALRNGRCDQHFNCRFHHWDDYECHRDEMGWRFTSGIKCIGRDQVRSGNVACIHETGASWLSIGSGGHQQLLLDSTGYVFSQSPHVIAKGRSRRKLLSSQLAAEIPNDQCVEFHSSLGHGWFCCRTQQGGLAFWHGNTLVLKLTSDARVWSQRGHGGRGGYFEESSAKAERIGLLNSELSFFGCSDNPVLSLGKDRETWLVCERRDPGRDSRVLAWYRDGILEFVTTLDGQLWTARHMRFLKTAMFNSSNDVITTAIPTLALVSTHMRCNGSYNFWLNGKYVASGMGSHSDRGRFDIGSAAKLVVAIQGWCDPNSGGCGFAFAADWRHNTYVTSSSHWRCVRGAVDENWMNVDYDDAQWEAPNVLGPVSDRESQGAWLWSHSTSEQVLCRATWAAEVESSTMEPPSTGHTFEVVLMILVFVIVVVGCGGLYVKKRLQSQLDQALMHSMFNSTDAHWPDGWQGGAVSQETVEDAVHASIISRFGNDKAAIDSILDSGVLDDIEIECVIGRGSSSVVYRAAWRGQRVALKQLTQTPRDSRDDNDSVMQVLDEFAGEVRIMSKLHHPNVIQYLGFTTTPQCLIIQEYASNGDLRSYLDPFATQPDHPDAPTQVMQLSMALDIVRGMAYLHTQQPILLHRDLKSPNLLLDLRDSEFFVKITDFGLAREKSELAGATGLMTVCGTPLWTAPEILKGENYNEKADVFSAALCIWELWSFTVPYAELGMGPMEVVLKVASENIRPRIPDSMPAFFAELVQRCWSVDPNDRPQFPELIRHVKSYARSANIPVRYDGEDPDGSTA